ncbi:MAG: tyrosine-type recombinase/integrase [Actinomycetota bacterium]|nr:tyrosine-type recombinase/integrase [Actinomycetota bacterium]
MAASGVHRYRSCHRKPPPGDQNLPGDREEGRLGPGRPRPGSGPGRRRFGHLDPGGVPRSLAEPHRLDEIAGVEDRGQPILAAAIAAATTGARRGELLVIRWSDVDLDHGNLHIRRAIKHADGPGWVVGPTKTQAQRQIALDEFSVQVLGRHLDAAGQRAGEACVAFDPDGHVFTFDPTGETPTKPDSPGQAFSRLWAKERVSGVSLHTCGISAPRFRSHPAGTSAPWPDGQAMTMPRPR